jgi:hypothetical protein
VIKSLRRKVVDAKPAPFLLDLATRGMPSYLVNNLSLEICEEWEQGNNYQQFNFTYP